MKKLLALGTLALSLSASAQTLFTYGQDSVSLQEFLRAYEKNNAGAQNSKALNDYLDLYIASRLKIAEAKALGYDTLPQMVADLDNLRQQIMPSYLVDKEALNRLVDEAFRRSQKDIRLSHIFIGTRNSTPQEVAAAENKAQAAVAALKSGKTFAEVARQWSEDPAAVQNGGLLGWITVFSLPYELENLAYATPVGQASALYRSRSGFHIFKNEGERKAVGTLKAAQILLAFPPESDAAAKAAIRRRADSLYQRLQKGDDFGRLAAAFSNDVVGAASGGVMAPFGAGDYDAVFEEKAFGLAKDGAITQPFETGFGLHIVKRLGRTPVATQKTEAVARQLKEKVEAGDRTKAIKAELVQKILRQAGFQKAFTNDAALWQYTDSVLSGKTAPAALGLTPTTSLASFHQQPLSSADWIGFAQTFRFKSDGSGLKPYPQLWSEFVEAQALDYYQKHLEDFNEEFRQQFNEFKEGNLFFEIMQRQVWGPAQTDSAGLQAFYNQNRQRYRWKESAAAVVFYATDSAAAQAFLAQLRKAPSRWQTVLPAFSEKISADSGRFELTQLPNVTKASKAGTVTPPVRNAADGSLSFAYLIRMLPAGGTRTFAEARGLVLNDYQAAREKAWLEELKKKYPVRVRKEVLSR